MIAVDESGENLIIVASGANHQVSLADVDKAVANSSDILVISAEIPAPAITQALAQAGPSILNLAPAPPDAAALVANAGALDWLVVNESEAAAVLGRPVDGPADAALAAAELIATGPRHAVVTAGAHGAALAGARTARTPSKGSRSPRSTPWGRATRSSAPSPSRSRPASRPRKHCEPPPPRAPPPSPGQGPRRPCPTRPTSRPPPV